LHTLISASVSVGSHSNSAVAPDTVFATHFMMTVPRVFPGRVFAPLRSLPYDVQKRNLSRHLSVEWKKN
jgi:hypothetical protein